MVNFKTACISPHALLHGKKPVAEGDRLPEQHDRSGQKDHSGKEDDNAHNKPARKTRQTDADL